MSDIAFSAVISVTGTANQIGSTGGLYPVITIANNPILPGTGSVGLPEGNTAARAGAAGAIRFNTQLTQFEGTPDGATWYAFLTGTGTVNSVTGTTNRIAVSPTTGNVVVDIDAAYVGQTSITTLGTITTGTWNATTIASAHGGTGFSTYTLGDIIYSSATNVLSKLAGNTTSGIQYLAQTGTGVVSAAPVWTTISGGDITGAALTKTDDTNVTLTLGGTPSTALLRAASLTLGWTGQLGLTRGGTAASLTASNGGLVYSTASALAILSGTATANQIPLSGSNSAPSWSTATYPATTTINQLLYSSAANTIAGLATANKAVLTTGATGIPVLTALATDGQVIIGSTAGVPAAATLTAGSGVTITNAGNSITIAATGSGGTVTSVSGTANRITSTGGTTPVIDISAAYVGQSSITTLGTITTGVWNGSVIPLAYGGTNANLTASNGGIFYSTASAGAILSGTATANQIVMSGASAAPSWSTATYPATTTVSQLLYSSSTNVIAGLATANSAVLVTDSTGVPVMSSTMTNGQVIIGSTGATPTAATLTAGSNVTITNAAGSITIAAASGAAGAWTKISNAVASSSASIAFTGLSNTYISYMIEFSEVVPGSNTVDFYAVFGTGGTPTYQTSAYYGNTQGGSSSSGIATYNFSNAAQITINSNNTGLHLTTTAGAALDGRLYISNPSQSSVNHQCTWQVVYQASGTETCQVPGGAEWRGTTAVTAIKFSMSSGNIASGTFTLYGLTG